MPVCDGETAWIEKVTARSFTEAESKFVQSMADVYECVDLGGTLEDARIALVSDNVTLGEIYDIEEF